MNYHALCVLVCSSESDDGLDDALSEFNNRELKKLGITRQQLFDWVTSDAMIAVNNRMAFASDKFDINLVNAVPRLFADAEKYEHFLFLALDLWNLAGFKNTYTDEALAEVGTTQAELLTWYETRKVL